MKTISALLLLISASSFAQLYTFNNDAISLSNKVIACGEVLTDLTKQGFKINSAQVVSKDIISDYTAHYPVRETAVLTALYLGKNYQPMVGYSELKKINITSTLICRGREGADGKCTETVNSCAVRDV